jgi:thiamine pyridinylase
MSRIHRLLTTLCILVFTFTTLGPFSTIAASKQTLSRRPLRVALYPFVPQKAEMYWKLEREFEELNKEIDIQYVDLGADYYDGDLVNALKTKKADVVEIDTVFLRDLVDQKLIQEMPSEVLFPQDTYLPMAISASTVDGKVYGIPHWICGNFLFFRKDDPEKGRFEKVNTLNGLERILGRPFSPEQGLLVDLQGKSTLGEKYMDAVLDIYQSPEEALKHVSSAAPDPNAIRSLDRLFALCPGGLCDSEKHHQSDQYYAKQFAHRKARALIGYSERMYYVVDEFINGLREDESGVGSISFVWNDATKAYDIIGLNDVDVVSAPLADSGSKMLAWVDILSLRSGLDEQTRKDANELIKFFNSEKFNTELLMPSYGSAPRYLLPARNSIYTNHTLLQAAPLYNRFFEIMKQSVSLTGPNLNGNLRDIGKGIQKTGLSPREMLK